MVLTDYRTIDPNLLYSLINRTCKDYSDWDDLARSLDLDRAVLVMHPADAGFVHVAELKQFR